MKLYFVIIVLAFIMCCGSSCKKKDSAAIVSTPVDSTQKAKQVIAASDYPFVEGYVGCMIASLQYFNCTAYDFPHGNYTDSAYKFNIGHFGPDSLSIWGDKPIGFGSDFTGAPETYVSVEGNIRNGMIPCGQIRLTSDSLYVNYRREMSATDDGEFICTFRGKIVGKTRHL